MLGVSSNDAGKERVVLIIHAIKSSDLFDLYFRDGNDLCWFGALPGDVNPKEHTRGIFNLFSVCEPELSRNFCTCVVYVYKREK